MEERDKLMTPESTDKLYIIVTTPLMDWMASYKDMHVTNRPDLIELVHSIDLNPEESLYY